MKMKKTYKNQLPNNMEVKSTNVRIENNELLIDIEFEEKFIPKDGDFLYNDHTKVMVIYKETTKDGDIISYIGSGKYITTFEVGSGWGCIREFRLATPEEKEDFLNRLKNKYNKKWNPITKQIENIR